MRQLGAAPHTVSAEDLEREFRYVGFFDVTVTATASDMSGPLGFDITLGQGDARRLLWLLRDEWFRQSPQQSRGAVP